MLHLPEFDATRSAEASASGDLALGFGSILAQLHTSRDGAPHHAGAIAEIGRVLSELASDGHVCLPIKELHRYLEAPQAQGQRLDDHQWRALVEASPVIGAGSAERLIAPDVSVIFDRERLYLQRYWRYESRLAAQLRLVDTNLLIAPVEEVKRVLDRLFADLEPINWQKAAAATALLRRLCLVTGGPGTGKTHTIARMLVAHALLAPKQRIALAAPTGKAALRLEQLIAQQVSELQGDGAVMDEDALAQVERLKAQTVHRLLGARPQSNRYRHDRDRPLPFDLVVIDEASMLDLAMASRLVDALPDHARLVLVGDADQLSSVETGTVFSELVSLESRDVGFAAQLGRVCGVNAQRLAAEVPEPLAIGNAVVRLRHSFRYRADGGIGTLAEAVRCGRVEEVMAMLADPPDELRFQAVAPASDPAGLAARLLSGFEPVLERIEERASIDQVLAALSERGVLAALRRGPLGATRLNQELARLVALRLAGGQREGWFPGRVVMVTRNDPLLKLYNGDIGIALEQQGALSVYFPEGSGHRAILPSRLGMLDSAFAVTVHKSQGSEFRHVDIILPQPTSPLATRELLYTALTRARESITLWGDPSTVAIAAASPTRRYSALAERIRTR
jgi:exodeoxyribonuclease V alpha subunit